LPHAVYTLGPPTRPPIRHDNGFLDRFQRRAPTVAERAQLAYWKSKLEAVEAGQRVPFLPHNDIPDALAAYRHFLEGGGRTREFSYERYVEGDASGRTTLENAILDARQGAVLLYERHYRGRDAQFSMTGSALAATGGSAVFPYPATENWQKAIGAHNFWISAEVAVIAAPLPRYVMHMTLHAEDRYNFNPEAQDIATGIPDSANGIFEVTGLARQYLNVSTLTRRVEWSGAAAGPAAVAAQDTSRQRAPSDNRRARNRL
jgi:hypothetical protein